MSIHKLYNNRMTIRPTSHNNNIIDDSFAFSYTYMAISIWLLKCLYYNIHEYIITIKLYIYFILKIDLRPMYSIIAINYSFIYIIIIIILYEGHIHIHHMQLITIIIIIGTMYNIKYSSSYNHQIIILWLWCLTP